MHALDHIRPLRVHCPVDTGPHIPVVGRLRLQVVSYGGRMFAHASQKCHVCSVITTGQLKLEFMIVFLRLDELPGLTFWALAFLASYSFYTCVCLRLNSRRGRKLSVQPVEKS